MNLKINKNKLENGLNTVKRITTKSSTLPILNDILIKTKDNFLNLSATDLEVGVRWWSLAEINKEEEIVVPTKVLSSFVNYLPEETVSINKNDMNLKIKCGNYKTQIKGLDSEDFPIIPEVENEDYISLNSEVFCEALDQVVNIAMPSSVKPEISGVYFSCKNNSLKIVATDSFRLGEKTISLDKKNKDDFSFILPQKAAKEIVNIFKGKEKEIKLYHSPNQVLFESEMEETDHPEVQLVSRLIEGEYPDYEEIIPQKTKTKVTLNLSEFKKQIKTANIFTSENKEVKIKVNPEENKLEFTSQNEDLGEHYSFIKVENIEGKPVEISFNCRFLIDGLNNINTNRGVLKLNGESNPALIKSTENTGYIYVIMPIKA
ncbi:MAG: DNA polymerase III subunit beta [Candidatus Woesearchaeota archaeon]